MVEEKEALKQVLGEEGLRLSLKLQHQEGEEQVEDLLPLKSVR